MTIEPLYIRNCEPVDAAAIPRMDTGSFLGTMASLLSSHGRIASYFGLPVDNSESVLLVAVIAFSSRGTLAVFSCRADTSMPSLSNEYPQLSLFEREIAEQFSIVFSGHPWFKPVRFCKPLSSAKNVFPKEIGNTDFFSVNSEEVHEVAVGPVHAGVIEPGHFRFQCHGENVFHLEISLGYQFRGIEKMLMEKMRGNIRQIIETCAGDTTAGHTTTYCQLAESLTSCDVPPRAQALRGIALELERCANHIGDIGALSGDVGYLPTDSFCGRIRGDALNATAILCGNRFSRNLIRQGGISFDVNVHASDLLKNAIAAIRADFTNAADLLWNASSVVARFDKTGILTKEQCEQFGIVGPAARASGCNQDIRQDFPNGIYQFSQMPIVTHHQGDVFARAFLRYSEVLHSLDFIESQRAQLPGGAICAAPVSHKRPDSFIVSLTEGWRGEICHAAFTDKNGDFARYKIVDPSFHNWNGLSLALRHQQISDFPLCNKSFNLSYCGHDL